MEEYFFTLSSVNLGFVCTARPQSQLLYGQHEFRMDRPFPPDIQAIDSHTINQIKGHKKKKKV